MSGGGTPIFDQLAEERGHPLAPRFEPFASADVSAYQAEINRVIARMAAMTRTPSYSYI